MTNKIVNALTILGISLCFWYIVYVIYIAGVKWAETKIEASGKKEMLIAGFLSVVEGKVIRADETGTIIEYYYEWDGINDKKVLPHANAAYPENAKVMVVYTLGMGMGSCLVVGFYKKYMLLCGIIGMILFVSGIILKWKRKGKETCQEGKL